MHLTQQLTIINCCVYAWFFAAMLLMWHRDRAALLLQPSVSYVSLKFINTGWMLWYTPIPSPIPVYNFTSSWLKAAKASCWPFPNPLGFWKYHEKSFPILSKLAQVYFTMSSSSVPVECMFSTTGSISDGKKSSIAPEKLNRVLFVHDNFSLIINDSC